MEQKLNPKLTKEIDRHLIDTGSPTFHEMRRFIEHRIDVLRRKNDNIKLDSVQTGVIRGGILELKDLLNSCDPKQMTVTPTKPRTG